MGNRYFHIKSPVLVFVFELFQVKVDIIVPCKFTHLIFM